jgi:hypothetical protein
MAPHTNHDHLIVNLRMGGRSSKRLLPWVKRLVLSWPSKTADLDNGMYSSTLDLEEIKFTEGPYEEKSAAMAAVCNEAKRFLQAKLLAVEAEHPTEATLDHRRPLSPDGSSTLPTLKPPVSTASLYSDSHKQRRTLPNAKLYTETFEEARWDSTLARKQIFLTG